MTPLLQNYRVNDAIEMMKPFNKETVAPFDVLDLAIHIICRVFISVFFHHPLISELIPSLNPCYGAHASYELAVMEGHSRP